MTPGAEIRRIRGQDHVVVTVSVMFPGPPPTIYGLARALHLQSDATFHALLDVRSNAPAVTALYRQQIGEPVPSLDRARRALRDAGTIFTANHQFPGGTTTPYLAWGVAPDGDRPIILPLSDGFRRVFEAAVRERQRQTRLAAIRPALDALGVELRAIRAKSRELSSTIDIARVISESSAREIAILEALNGLLGAMLSSPKGAVDPADRRDVEALRAQLRSLIDEANRHMLLEPVDAFAAGLVADRAREATELLALIENPAFVSHVHTLAENRDIVEPQLYRDTIDTVSTAFQTLLGSPQSGPALTRHVEPMLSALAARPIDLTGLSAPVTPGLDAAIRAVPAPPPADSVLVILVGTAGMLPLAVGNYPGPNTLAVGVLQWAVSAALANVASDRAAAVALAGKLFRALVTTASVRVPAGGTAPQPLSLADRAHLLNAIDRGDLQLLRRIDWSARFQSGPAWGSAIAVASAISLFAAVQSDDASTLRRWANILGSASGTALGVSVAVGRYSALVQAGMVTGVAGRALGVVGGFAAVVSGTVTAVEEYQSRDRVGMWLAIGGATGGALSVAGFLIGAGAATSATVAGAPVGVVLMVTGAIIGIGTGVVTLVRGLITAGSQIVFETLLNHFGRGGGPYDTAAAQRPTLRAAFTTVQTAHHPVDFWDVHPDRTPELHDLGFSPAHITQIVAESEANVNNRLRTAGRIP